MHTINNASFRMSVNDSVAVIDGNFYISYNCLKSTLSSKDKEINKLKKAIKKLKQNKLKHYKIGYTL